MIRQEAILQSTLRILDRSIRGGLGKGHLGVIMAPAGVGKSACLVQLGLDALLRESDGRGLDGSDPDRQVALALQLLEDDDALVRDKADADRLDD